MSANNDEYDDLSLEPEGDMSDGKVMMQNSLKQGGNPMFDPDINELIENYSLSAPDLSDREDEDLMPERGRSR